MSKSNSTAGSVWLITGCSSGIGREIATVALEKGHRVVVTARNPQTVESLVSQYPDRAIARALDVTRRNQITQVVADTEREFGRIDVLVNNAGYGYLAAIEEGEEAEVRAMFDTNLFGLIAMTRAVLPGMRSRRSGHIINISSMAGLLSNPGTGYYSATKFAVEAITEALSKEVAPFGIRVTGVQPGAFRTDWSGRSLRQTSTPIEAYADTVGARRAMIRNIDGKQPGDPRRAAEAIVAVAEHPQPPLRLLLGRDVYNAYRAKLDETLRAITEWEAVTLSTDFQ